MVLVLSHPTRCSLKPPIIFHLPFKLKLPYCHNIPPSLFLFFLYHCLPFFSWDITSANPIPPRLFSVSPYHPLPLCFCHPVFYFIRRGGGAIYFLATCPLLWWQLVSLSKAHLFLISTATLASWHHRASYCTPWLVCSSLGSWYCFAVLQVIFIEQACMDLHVNVYKKAA